MNTLQAIATAPDHDDPLLLFTDYGDGTVDYYIGCRSRHGPYWIAQPDARIITPTHWCNLPRKSDTEEES